MYDFVKYRLAFCGLVAYKVYKGISTKRNEGKWMKMTPYIAFAVVLVASACGGKGPLDPLVKLPAPATMHILVSKPSPYFACDGTVNTGDNTAGFTCASSSGTWDVTGILEYQPFLDRAQVHIRALPEDEGHYPASGGYALAIDFTPSESGVAWTGWATIYPPDEQYGHMDLAAVGWVERASR
jgi:hypothetical protein